MILSAYGRYRPKISHTLFMVALWNMADQHIFILSFVFLLSSFFFPRLLSAVAEWVSAILAHMVWS